MAKVQINNSLLIYVYYYTLVALIINLQCYYTVMSRVGPCYETMNKTNNSLSKFTSVFHECGKGSVSWWLNNTNVNIMININDDKHRNKEDEWPRNLSHKYEWNIRVSSPEQYFWAKMFRDDCALTVVSMYCYTIVQNPINVRKSSIEKINTWKLPPIHLGISLRVDQSEKLQDLVTWPEFWPAGFAC